MMRWVLVALLLLSAGSADATTYYVRTDGNNSNSGTTNSSGGAWLTITKGCSTATAGDVVRVQAGTYVETASGCTSGTSGNTVTLVADGAVTTCGMSFNAKSYIRVIGFTMNPTASSCGGSPNPIVQMTGTNTGLEFWNNDLGHVNGKGWSADGSARCNACIVLGGSIHDICADSSCADTGLVVTGDDSFVGYINLATICYIGVGPSGHRQRILNLNFSGFLQCQGSHPDFYYPQGLNTFGFSNNLIESTFSIGTVTSTDNKFAHNSNQIASDWTDNIYRGNVAYNLGSGFYSVYTNGMGGLYRFRFYHNTLVNCTRASSGVPRCGNINVSPGSVYIYNTLFYQAWSDDVTTGIDVWAESAGTFFKDYNLAFSPLGSDTFTAQWTGQSHPQTNVDPKLTNVSSQDFTLQSSSGARGVGGPMTTATSCSGTTLNVATNTGSLFIGDNSGNLAAYSGKLVPGDFVTVNAAQYQVSSVSGDALTLASSITCSNGDAVYFGKSATIDIGAYPYKASGYSLSATYACAGGTCTITPNDASLVRFVVCYDSNVPYAVANASPFTCSTATGTFRATVYPAYASLTLSVDATAGATAGGSLSTTRLRIP